MLNDNEYPTPLYSRNTSSPPPNVYFSDYIQETKVNESKNVTSIYLYQPNMRIQLITIKSDRPISSLSRSYKHQMCFIYDGQILNKEKTFSEYRIPNRSKISMLPETLLQMNSAFKEKWLNLTLDKENFDKKIEMSVNSKCRSEMLRLHDLRYNKLEMKRRNHNFFIKSRFGNQNCEEQSNFQPGSVNNVGLTVNSLYELYKKGSKMNDVQLDVSFDKSDSPTEEPLPVIW